MTLGPAFQDISSTSEKLLNSAGLHSLHIRRLKTMAFETFKHLSAISVPVLSDLVVKLDSKINFKYSNILQAPRVKTTTYGKTPTGMQLLNYGIYYHSILGTVHL